MDAIRRIVRALRVSSRDAERRVGLSGAQLFVLQQLALGPAPSLNELAARTLTHQSSVSVVVQRLVSRGLVERLRSPSDGRRIELSLTAEGRAVLDRAPGAAQEQLLEGLSRMPAASRQQLAQLLTWFVTEAGLSEEAPTLFFEE
jgi:DNA-binding MarR family transcriptional regulator